MDDIHPLEFVARGGAVRRFHGVSLIHPQTNAEHMFGVAHLVSYLALGADLSDGEGLTVPLLLSALVSDLPEWVTGDMPAPAKRSMPDILGPNGERTPFRQVWNERDAVLLREVGLDWEHELSPQQTRWLKLADAMEGCLFCIKERTMGNRTIGPRCYVNFRQYIRDVLGESDPSETEQEVIDYIDAQWEQANG